jgi:hypothetical protein
MLRIDAVVVGNNGKAYFLQGSEYIRYDLQTFQVDPGYPKPIATNWPGLWGEDIDAAVNWGSSSGKAYFFKGGDFIGYDLQGDKADDGFPKPIEGNWSGLWDSDIDAAVNWGNGKLYFFKGSEYIRYDLVADKADDGYPQPIEGNWAGLWNAEIDAAVNWGNGKVYFFRGDEYVSYDIATDSVESGYPQPIAGGWPPLGALQVQPGAVFSFTLQPGENIGARIVRCCEDALSEGPMGQRERHDFYREFISCGQERTSESAEALTTVRTSCAMFVRAVLHWCGSPATGPYVTGTGMFVSMGNVNFTHAAFVPSNGTKAPSQGDYFYISTTRQSSDGHTGIFIEQIGPNEWRTAEGGGGDGTLCRFTTRMISGDKFDNDNRRLWGWFDCTKVGLPDSPTNS